MKDSTELSLGPTCALEKFWEGLRRWSSERMVSENFVMEASSQELLPRRWESRFRLG